MTNTILDSNNQVVTVSNYCGGVTIKGLNGLPLGCVANSTLGEIYLKVGIVAGALTATTEGKATAAAPSYVEGSTDQLSMELNGSLRVVLKAETTKVIGTINIAASQVIGLAAGTALIGKVAAAQYTGAPSSSSVQTADGTVFTLAANEVGFIQNLDDAALAVKKGASASTSSFSFILAAGSAADDGKGGYTTIKDWVGAVSVAAIAGTARYIAWKQAP